MAVSIALLVALGPGANVAAARTTPAAVPGAQSLPGGAPGVASPSTRALCGTPVPGSARCFALLRTDIAPRTRAQVAAPAVSPAGYSPADLLSAYALGAAAASGGAGVTVAIVDAYDSPSAESDLATYRTEFSLPACTTANGCFHKVDQDGGTSYPAPDASWAAEIALDIEMVSAICPACHILLVEATTNNVADLGTAVNTAVGLGVRFVSNSYGGAEDASAGLADSLFFDHPGVVITASAGDAGYEVEYPAASPYVVAVGGTSLVAAPNARGWSETTWAGTGSGCSAYEPKPAWQHDAGCPNRTVGDVSAVADPNTGVAVYSAAVGVGGWAIFGGTSASAPIVAAAYALAAAPVAGTYPAGYPYVRGGLNDVTSGSNGACGGTYLCVAKAGYDGPTGLGTPNGTAPFTAASLPGAPTGVSGVAGNAQAGVSWSAPASDGGSTITGYTVTSSPGGRTCAWTAGPLACTVSSLTNGTAYSFTVKATTIVGTGPSSSPSAPVTPRSVPGAPTGVAAVPGDGQAVLAWSPPASNGGSAITGYTVTSTPDGRTCTWTSGPLRCTVTGLTDGTPYTFTVSATNAAGTGPASGASSPVTPASVPGAPTAVTAIAGNAQVGVSWTAPSSTGGSPVTGYTVTSSPDGRTCAWTSGPLSCTVSSLANGTSYTFAVTAANAIGPGPGSVPSAAVTPRTVPTAPTGVSATPGDTFAAVSWSVPASDGGMAITGYTATATPGGRTCSWTSGPRSCTITGLADGTSYAVTVTATNGTGTGLASSPPALVTPATHPGAPSGVSATAGSTQALVAWSAPVSDGGSAITGYTVTSSPGGKTCAWTSGLLSCTVTGLTNLTPYTFTVVATNSVGAGPASVASPSVTPGVPPSAHITPLPTWSLSTAIALSWGATPGTNPVAGYDVQVRRAPWNGNLGAYSTWKNATRASGATYAGTPGNTYCFRVLARDTSGRASAVTPATCIVLPLDERSLGRSAGWTSGAGSAFYRSTYLRSSTLGVKLTRTGVVARRIALVATTCPTCGSVRLYWGSTFLRTVSLYSATTVNRRVIAATTFTSVRRGTLTIRVISSGRRVLIDGLAIRRV